jgi:carboxylesterase type B
MHNFVEGRPSLSSRLVVELRNGTYVGVHSTKYNQDYFLGIPYGQQPVGNFRFRVPKSLNETWMGGREANVYATFCIRYGVSQQSSEYHHSNIDTQHALFYRARPFGIICPKPT